MTRKIIFTILSCILGTIALEAQPTDSLVVVEREILIATDTVAGVDSTSVTIYTKKNGVTDTTKIVLGNSTITIVNKEKGGSVRIDDENDEDADCMYCDSNNSDKYRLTWWNGIDLGVNGILSNGRDFNLDSDVEGFAPSYGKSRYISLNFAQIKGRIVNDYVGITTGMTFQIYNWKYDGENEFAFAGDSLFVEPNTDKNITKNKLRASYFGIPVMLDFNTSLDPDRAFHISAGVVGKVLIGSMYKQKYNTEGNSYKAALKGDLGFNRWQVDAIARVGYRRLAVFAQVGLLPLFDNDNTPDLYSFSAGFFIKV